MTTTTRAATVAEIEAFRDRGHQQHEHHDDEPAPTWPTLDPGGDARHRGRVRADGRAEHRGRPGGDPGAIPRRLRRAGRARSALPRRRRRAPCQPVHGAGRRDVEGAQGHVLGSRARRLSSGFPIGSRTYPGCRPAKGSSTTSRCPRGNEEEQAGELITEVTDEGVTDKRLLVVESEFASVLRVAQRQGNTLSATIREAWDSGNLRTLTKNDPMTATGAHICIVGHITADELRAELTATDTRTASPIGSCSSRSSGRSCCRSAATMPRGRAAGIRRPAARAWPN